jgi:hypothetical protein
VNWLIDFVLRRVSVWDYLLTYKLGKGKVVPVLNQAPRHEGVLGEWKYRSTHSLTSALDGGEWSASRPSRFTSRERAPGTRWIGGWVGPRAVMEAVVKWTIPISRRESNPRTPIVQPVALYGLSCHGSYELGKVKVKFSFSLSTTPHHEDVSIA